MYPFEDIKPHAIYGEAMGKLGHKEKDKDMPAYYMMEDGIKIIHQEAAGSWEAYDTGKDPGDINSLPGPLPEDKKSKLESFISRNK